MKTQNVGFDEQKVLHHLTHYLPAQNPLKDFVHHNTLHAFQHKEFHEALAKANTIFGYKTYLSLVEFRNRFAKNEIKEQVLNHVISKCKGVEHLETWNNKLLISKGFEIVKNNYRIKTNGISNYNINRKVESFLCKKIIE